MTVKALIYAGNVVHAMTFKALTDTTHKNIFHSSLLSTEEPMVSNLHLESICGEFYPFTKPLTVRDEQI